jgi:hypothetical protein
MTLSFILIGLSIACRAVGELHAHGKLRFKSWRYGFSGSESWKRKYKGYGFEDEYSLKDAAINWYTKLFKIKYKERWPTSTNFTVAVTDLPHLTQSISFLTLSLGVSLLANVNFFLVWIPIIGIHATVYRLLQR